MSIEEQILGEAIRTGVVDSSLTAIGVMDLDGLSCTVDDLKQAFPSNFRHAFAVKANALTGVLRSLKSTGIGAEVASPGELELALAAGFTPDEIIYDSPAKTMAELHRCLRDGISINLDNEQELHRVDELIKEFPNTRSVIGFRVNPQIGSGSISSTSTATGTSKFGYATGDGINREILLKLYAERPWLTSIHTHSGSQGCSLELMADGVAAIVAIAEDVNAASDSQKIRRINIGGGLAVNFKSAEITPTFQDYADVLKARVPILFTGKYQAKTEFGRAIAAKNGFMITRVEYTKESGGRHIATTHVGAQAMARTAFLPEAWSIRVGGFDPAGRPRTENPVLTNVAGPCCFAADLVAKGVTMPMLEPDDYVVVYDTGAYYFSNHFDYNSFPRLPVYATQQVSNELRIDLIRQAETLDKIVENMS